jgi:hypothetical protein
MARRRPASTAPREGASAPTAAGPRPGRAVGRWHRRIVRVVRRRPLAVAAILILVHVALGLLTFQPRPHTGGDNAAYITLGESLLERGAYLELWDPAEPPHTKYPPVFPAVLAIAMALGLQPWVQLKLVVLGFSATAVAIAFFWMRSRRRAALGLAVAALLAVSPGVLRESRWILSDVPFWAFSMVALWAFDRLRADDWPRFGRGRRRHAPRALHPVRRAAPRRRRRRMARLAQALGAVRRAVRRDGRAVGAVVAAVPCLRGGRLRVGVLAGGALPAGTRHHRSRRPGGPHLRERAEVRDDPSAHAPGGGERRDSRRGECSGSGARSVGLGRRLHRPRVAELFLPAYLGLILVWPAVWSGERFLSPSFPCSCSSRARAMGRLARRLGERGAAAGVLAVALVALMAPALAGRGRGPGVHPAVPRGRPIPLPGQPVLDRFLRAGRHRRRSPPGGCRGAESKAAPVPRPERRVEGPQLPPEQRRRRRSSPPRIRPVHAT